MYRLYFKVDTIITHLIPIFLVTQQTCISVYVGYVICKVWALHQSFIEVHSKWNIHKHLKPPRAQGF